MRQISNFVYCDDFIADLRYETRLMANPYYDYPYLIIENFLSAEACAEIAAYTSEKSEGERALVKHSQLGVIVPELEEDIRKTAIHQLPEALLEGYNLSFAYHQKQIEDYFKVALTTATEVQALEYTNGGFYIKHADDSNELVNSEGETVGFTQVAPARKITTVLFATTHRDEEGEGMHFSGGELRFNYLSGADGVPVCIRPKAGDMVIFPSNPVYSHEVLPVTGGYRLTLVQWHDAIIS
ncbi:MULTISPECIES: 2OG-Fe(II) oxygenase [Sulfurimonas]|uniref:2OG-Fe(II) oxygenase n=1 Tax=Sulfurimonas diazotrophicus TaxID=3131939 RepID=A0ABZ3HB26_9BACT